jgi:tetratricopeptide (TPR) repeat protein
MRVTFSWARLTFSGLALFFAALFFPQSQKIDSLNFLLQKANHDTTRVSLLAAICEYIYIQNPDTLIPIGQRIIALADKNYKTAGAKENKAFLSAKGAALNNIGYVFYIKGNTKEAVANWEKSLAIMTKLCSEFAKGDNKCKLQIASNLNNLAAVYNNQGNIPASMEYHHKSLRIREEAGDKEGIAFSLANIGALYSNQKDFTRALDYHLKSLGLREEIKDKRGIAESYTNIGFVYNNLADTSRHRDSLLSLALDYYNRSLVLQEEIADKIGIPISLNNIGAVYFEKGELAFNKKEKANEFYERALDYYNRSRELREKAGDKQGLAYTLNNIGGVYLRLNDYKKAELYCTKGFRLASELNFPLNMREACEKLNKIYAATGRYKEALRFYKLYVSLSDSLMNEEVTKKTTRQQLQYEFDKKERAQLSAREKKDALAAEKLKQQKMIVLFVGACLLLVALFAVFILRSFLQKRNANRLLEEKNLLIEKQKALVEAKQKEILDSIYYARRIQRSLLTPDQYILKNLKRLKKKN